MPGNRAIYDRAMDQSREAARQKRWDDALKSAVRALQEFPQDINSRTSAAVALFHTNKLAQSLQILEELRAADPQNPFFLGYIARAHEGQSNVAAAIEAYTTLADLHQSQRVAAQTIEAIREILRLRPDMDDQRQRLARLLEETNAIRDAAAENLILAQRYFDQGRLDDAAAATEVALSLDPNSRDAKDLIVAIREAMKQAVHDAPLENAPASADTRVSMAGMTGTLRSQQFALEKIVALAIEKQEAGDIDEAIEHYERAVNGGMERADVLYSLGLLYQERANHQAAVQVLERATYDPEYALSAHFALGSSYKELNQLQRAAQEYEQTIGLVDLDSIGKAESEDLIQMYESVVAIYQQIGDLARAASLFSTLASFLQNKRWGKDRAAEFHQRAKELTERNMFAKLRTLGTGALTTPDASSTHEPDITPEEMPKTWGKLRSITDFLRADRVDQGTSDFVSPVEPPVPVDPLKALDSLPAPEKPTFAPVTPLDTTGIDEPTRRWIIASEKYIDQGLLEAALDACHEVISMTMDYFPIHLRMGEIYERQGQPEEAISKYQLLIDTYTVRQEATRAIDVYFRFIELSPDTINARSRLADLLKQTGRIDEATEQLIQVASTYFRMGQTNRALEEYRRLLQWAPQNPEIHAQYGLALFKLERYEAALGEFRKVIDLGGNDPVAIAHMNMTLALVANHPSMVWDSLATLLDQLKTTPQANDAVQAEYRTALIVADDPLLHYILGIIQQYSNQHSSALLEFEQAQTLVETDEHAMLPTILLHQAMADSHIALGNAEEALAQLNQGQLVAPQQRTTPASKHPFAATLSKGDFIRRMAEAHAASDDLEGAEKALVEARQLHPYDRTITQSWPTSTSARANSMKPWNNLAIWQRTMKIARILIVLSKHSSMVLNLPPTTHPSASGWRACCSDVAFSIKDSTGLCMLLIYSVKLANSKMP